MPATTRGQRTRQLILDRTAHVFDQRGFSGATLNRLVASTGLTRGAFYFHFESKDALAAAIAEEQALRWQQLRGQVERAEPDPLRRLVMLVSATAVAFRDDPKARAAGRLLIDRGQIRRDLPRTAPWWRRTLGDLIRQGVEAGLVRDLSFLRREAVEASGDPAEVSADHLADRAADGAGGAARESGDAARLAGYLVSQLASIGQAAMSRPGSQFDLLYMQWGILLPRICVDERYAEDLLSLAREILGTTEPAPA